MDKKAEEKLVGLGAELVITAAVIDQGAAAHRYFIGSTIAECWRDKTSMVVKVENP